MLTDEQIAYLRDTINKLGYIRRNLSADPEYLYDRGKYAAYLDMAMHAIDLLVP